LDAQRREGPITLCSEELGSPWKAEKNLSISQDKAYGVAGRPATPGSEQYCDVSNATANFQNSHPLADHGRNQKTACYRVDEAHLSGETLQLGGRPPQKAGILFVF